MESKRVPSARSAKNQTAVAAAQALESPTTTGLSNSHTQHRQLTNMLEEAKQECSELQA